MEDRNVEEATLMLQTNKRYAQEIIAEYKKELDSDLTSCCRANQCKGAIELFERLFNTKVR